MNFLAPMKAASFFGASEASAEKDKADSGTRFRNMQNGVAPKNSKEFSSEQKPRTPYKATVKP